MNIIPTLPLTKVFCRETISELAIKMPENFNKEREELFEQLDIVLELNSPFLIQRILSDDPIHIKDPGNISGRLQSAKINGEQQLNKYYWDTLAKMTSSYFYPKCVCNFGPRYFFTENKSWGQVWKDFTAENVELFLKNFVFQPYSEELAKSIVNCGKSFAEIDSSSILMMPFVTYCDDLNTYITAENVIAAALYLKHGRDENWLEFSRKTTFALNDYQKKHELFHLIKTKHDEFSTGARIDLSFASIFGLTQDLEAQA